MNILFISYWGINEGLSQATVLPHVRLLASFNHVSKVILCSVERDKFEPAEPIAKVVHVPLISKRLKSVLLNKVIDFVSFTNALTKIVVDEDIQLIICRSSLAGGFGYRVARNTRVPYVVESFEPHASYMLESGVWNRFDPRYRIERYFQKVQRRTAKYLLPVSNNYAEFLLKNGVSKARIIVVPCVVNADVFYRKANSNLRQSSGIAEDAIVGIYVGKFGGLYYEEESFSIFALAKEVFNNFFLLILTPDDRQWVESGILQNGFSPKEFKVVQADHNQVPEFLSISDFAFATYKPSFSKKYLSPIKIGEYWSCGLPVLLTEGVGDDSSIIEREECGATFSIEKQNIIERINKIRIQLQNETAVRAANRKLATIHRNPEILKRAYLRIIEDIIAR